MIHQSKTEWSNHQHVLNYLQAADAILIDQKVNQF
jgi:hypothetical protein